VHSDVEIKHLAFQGKEVQAGSVVHAGFRIPHNLLAGLLHWLDATVLDKVTQTNGQLFFFRAIVTWRSVRRPPFASLASRCNT